MSALTTDTASGDVEQQTGAFFSLLHNYLPESSAAALEPPDLDVVVCHMMKRVLDMDKNRIHERRLLTEVCRLATKAGAGSSQAQAVVEHVITNTADPAACGTAPPMGPEGRRALLDALDRVGVYARDNPFPAPVTIPCERRINCPIFTAEGDLMTAPDGSTGFEALRPVGDSRGLYSGSWRCYTMVQTLKNVFYGSIKLAHVIRVEYTGANSVVLWWTDERVVVKCISKAAMVKVKGSGEPINENPLREIGCLAFLIRRMNGTLAGPEMMRGDPQRVLPMVDLLEDAETFYMVRSYYI